MIQISKLYYENESKILFENVNKLITEGQYTLVGNNGIGKTCLLNLITKNLTPQRGNTHINGSYIYINQDPLLLENLSVKRNIIFFNQTNSQEIINKLKDLNINKKVKHLSGGQKQLVYLLICLYSNYDIYLIDEPFNNLDKNKVHLIYELINTKHNVIVVDHLKKFKFSQLVIKGRGII